MVATGTTEELLRKTQMFGTLDSVALQSLASYCRRRTYKSKTDIFHEGDMSQTLFIIVAGYVNIERAKGEDIVHIARRGPGEVIGELAVLDEQPRSADAVTDTECQLLMLDRVDIKRFVFDHPEAAWQLIRVLSARLREASNRLVQTETADALGKIASVLLEAAQENAPDEKGHVLLPHFPDEKVAQRAGVTRETANRRIASLRKTGIVRRDGRALVIVNCEKLRLLVESR